jgi:hypothetical protein
LSRLVLWVLEWWDLVDIFGCRASREELIEVLEMKMLYKKKIE